MSLFDFLFPEQAEAAHLRSLSKSMRRQAHNQRMANTKKDNLEKELKETKEDLEFSNLLLSSLIRKLVEKDILSKEELLETIQNVDLLDGIKDGKLNSNSLRGDMGLPKEEKAIEKSTSKKKVIRVKKN